MPRVPVPQPSARNEAWVMGFILAGTSGVRTLRTLKVIDCCKRECLLIEVETSITGKRVVAVLALLVAMRGKPKGIRVDNGPEFGSKLSTPGPSSKASRSTSSVLRSRPRTVASRASTADWEMSVSTSIGSLILPTRMRRSSFGGVTTTR